MVTESNNDLCEHKDVSTIIFKIVEILISLAIFVAAIIGFSVNEQTTRLQTSMEFCSTIYPILQSQEFVEREHFLKRELSKLGNEICPIEDIENDSLKHEIYAYCECLNGIGIMIHEHMINHNVIIPYIGVNTIYIYRKLKPYLYMTRQERVLYVSPELSDMENKKIQRAASLYFVHYELLVLEMERQGEKWTEDLQSELDMYQQ